MAEFDKGGFEVALIIFLSFRGWLQRSVQDYMS